MENLNKLLEQLAIKLGTTAQYLWGVLVRQAAIDATIDLILLVISVIFLFILHKLHIRFSQKKQINGHNENTYERLEGMAILPMVLSAIFILFMFFIQLFSIGNIISGYFNPEYWALHKILEQLK